MAKNFFFSAEQLCEVTDPNFKTAEVKVGETRRTFSVGRVLKSKDLYHNPSRATCMARLNVGIHAYSDWQQEKLNIFTNPEKTKIYAEIDPRHCVDSYSTFTMNIFAEKTGEKAWKVLFSNALPKSHLASYAISLVAGTAMDLFQETVKDFDGTARDNSVEFFCDAIYNGFCYCHDIECVESDEDKVSELFALADLNPLLDSCVSVEAVAAEADPEIEDYYTWDSIVRGEHRIDYDWAPEAVEHIPPLSTLDKFVPTKEFIAMLVLVEQSLSKIKGRMDAGLAGEEALGEDAVNMKLSGPPGSGKSFALKCLAAALGMPFWVTSFNPNSDESFAEGKTRMVGSEPKHTDSPLTMCQMYGGISAGEEPNTGDPEMIFGVYSQIVESPYTLYRNGCEAVIRHPLAVYAILYNKNCGSATMHAALLNRFNQPFKFMPASKEEFISMLLKRGDDVKASTSTEDINKFYNEFATRRKKLRKTPRMISEWIYKAYSAVINGLDSSSGRDAAEAISLRSCYGVLQSIMNGEDPMTALRSLTDNVGDFDAELEESITTALQSKLSRL